MTTPPPDTADTADTTIGPGHGACPRCASSRTISYGSRIGCCSCGATWQAPR